FLPDHGLIDSPNAFTVYIRHRPRARLSRRKLVARTTWYLSAETTFSQHLQKPQGSATFGEDRERRLRAAGTEPKDKQEFASLRDNDLNTARTPVVGRSLMAFKLKTQICK